MSLSQKGLMRNPIIILKPGTETSGNTQLILSNIRTCAEVADVMRTTLGPMGRDKLIRVNKKTHITNDGATIISLLNPVHPAARILLDISKAQDSEIGDGTTSVVLLASAMLESAAPLIEQNVNPRIIVAAYSNAMESVQTLLHSLALDIESVAPNGKEEALRKCAAVSLNSKLLSNHKELFAGFVVSAIQNLLRHNNGVLDRKLINIVKVPGGHISESQLLQGVLIPKAFSYAGFELAPKQFSGEVKILLLTFELELKPERESAEIRIDDVKLYQKMIDAEWKVLTDRLDAIVASGCNVVLSVSCIGDIATQYLATRNVFCAGRISKSDFQLLARATGAVPLQTLSHLDPKAIGHCGNFEEIQLGDHRFNLFNKCRNPVVSTLLLRGASTHYLDEAERSLNDSILACCCSALHSQILAGGGAVEIQVVKHLEKYALQFDDKVQTIIMNLAKAFETIPRTLALSADFNALEVITRLRNLHDDPDNRWFGVHCLSDSDNCVTNMLELGVWEPLAGKINCYNSALEACAAILSIDYMVKNPKSNPDPVN